MNLIVSRTSKTSDGIRGNLIIDGLLNEVTLENLEHSFPAGTYEVVIDHSPRMGYYTPHIKIPVRDAAAGGDAGIRLHKANWPFQLEGCIAVGTKAEADAIDDSKDAFGKLMTIVAKPSGTDGSGNVRYVAVEPLTITVNDAYQNAVDAAMGVA